MYVLAHPSLSPLKLIHTRLQVIQAMLLFPSVAQAAQQELDRTCGARMPTLDDWPHLPYLSSCIKETLRWMPTVISGAPHALTRDDEYMGYTIPQGAAVLPNTWAIHNDAARHPDPRCFDPTRYMHDRLSAAESASQPDPSLRDHFGFGAGRRICQGMHIAERSLFLAMARILWAFDIRPARDAAGAEILPDPSDLTEGTLSQPKPFPARITPRDAKKVARIRDEWAGVEMLLDQEGQWKVVPEGLIWGKGDNRDIS
jgi:cytochrome P450